MSTLQKALPAWSGNDMIVPCPVFLQDAWDASDSFAEAFVSVYQQITEGYDAAVAEGRIRHDGDVVVDDDAPAAELQKALLRGEGWFGAAELARRYACCRQTVWRVATEMGVSLKHTRGKGAAREVAEAHFRDGETRPRVILAAIAQQFPTQEPPKRNTITQWRLRWEAAEAQ